MTHLELLEAVNYCRLTGIFTRTKAAGNLKAGAQIGNPTKKGYLKALVLGKYVTLHRLAWFYVHGLWPKELDHIDEVKTNNAITNLRVCTTSLNCLNQSGPRTNNSLGLQGVHRITKTGRYRAVCMVNGTKHHLGVFATPEEASNAYSTFKQPFKPT